MGFHSPLVRNELTCHLSFYGEPLVSYINMDMVVMMLRAMLT